VGENTNQFLRIVYVHGLSKKAKRNIRIRETKYRKLNQKDCSQTQKLLEIKRETKFS
jgi:hypothetical protein